MESVLSGLFSGELAEEAAAQKLAALKVDVAPFVSTTAEVCLFDTAGALCACVCVCVRRIMLSLSYCVELCDASVTVGHPRMEVPILLLIRIRILPVFSPNAYARSCLHRQTCEMCCARGIESRACHICLKGMSLVVHGA